MDPILTVPPPTAEPSQPSSSPTDLGINSAWPLVTGIDGTSPTATKAYLSRANGAAPTIVPFVTLSATCALFFLQQKFGATLTPAIGATLPLLLARGAKKDDLCF